MSYPTFVHASSTDCIIYADIAAQLSSPEASQLQFTIILEPDSLGNLVTNLSVEKCANAADAYREGISYVSPMSSFYLASLIVSWG